MIDIKVIASGSKGNCYLITCNESSLLIECGIPIKAIKKALNFKLSSVCGCLVTHGHQDHAKAARDLAKSGIDIYTSTGTMEMIGGLPGHRFYAVKPKHSFTVEGWQVLPFETQHDCPGSVGFVINSAEGDRLLFLTDSAYVKYLFPGISHLMIECNFSNEILEDNIKEGNVEASRRKRLLSSHFSLERVKDFLKANDLSRLQSIFLVHLSDQNSNEVQFKKEIQALTGVPVTVC